MSVNKNRNVYKGLRYVPKIEGEWDKTRSYEGLTIVTHEGTSYTSKQHVPEGIDILNTDFWVVTGNYNAQVESYRQDVRDMQEQVEGKADKELVDNLNNKLDRIVYELPSNGVNDTTNINTALEMLDNLGGGDLILTSPNYIYNGDIHIRENIFIRGKENTTLTNTAGDNAKIIFYNDVKMENLKFEINEFYDDSVFYFANQYLMSTDRNIQTGENAKVKISNVKMKSNFNDNTVNKTAIEFYATFSGDAGASYAGFWGVLLEKLDLDGFNNLVKMYTEKTGWINGNIIKDTTAIRFTHAVVVTKSPNSLGIDNNEISMKLQTTSHTRELFVDGVSTNNYNNCTYWDMRTNTLSRVGTGLSRGSVDGITYPKERYATYLLSGKYHLLGRFSRFTNRVHHVKISVSGYGNLNTNYVIRGYDDIVERQIMGSNRLNDGLRFFKRDVGNGEVEVYIYNELDVEFEANIHIESFRTFYPSPMVYYDTVPDLVELTEIQDFFPSPRGMYTIGENENGAWVQYEDGTMICRLNRTTDLLPDFQSGAIYRSEQSERWDFPMPFATSRHLNVNVSVASANRWGDIASSPSVDGVSYMVYSSVESTTPTNVTLIATGFWK